MTARCFVCAARMWEPTNRTLLFRSGERRSFRFACASCGVLCDAPEDAERCRADLRRRLREPVFAASEAAPYGLDIYTLRTAATAQGLRTDPADAEQRSALAKPHATLAASARLVPLEPRKGAPVALGILCRPGDLDMVLADAAAHREWASEIVVMVDAANAPAGGAGDVRILARPLADDFAEQRNALQAASGCSWMIQLDADESLSPETGALLPALAELADRNGAVSIGLARRNRVDGLMSDVFPDVQYRLNRRNVRYEGRVHERPVRPWQRSFIALHGAIEHHLSRDHVLSRSLGYEAIAPGRGRLEEAGALLEPYRD